MWQKMYCTGVDRMKVEGFHGQIIPGCQEFQVVEMVEQRIKDQEKAEIPLLKFPLSVITSIIEGKGINEPRQAVRRLYHGW
jgi:hypothetical protein